MISRELVDKINALWHKQQTVGLTAEEKEEQRLAREQYMQAMRTQVRGILDTIKEAPGEQGHSHSHGCSCDTCKQ